MAKNNVTVGTFKNDCKVMRLDADEYARDLLDKIR